MSAELEAVECAVNATALLNVFNMLLVRDRCGETEL